MLAGTVVLVAVMVPLAAGREEAFDTVLYATLPLVLTSATPAVVLGLGRLLAVQPTHLTVAGVGSLQIVADYKRVSAVQAAGHPGHGRASGPQSPGVAEDAAAPSRQTDRR